jgi:hypothetical protein
MSRNTDVPEHLGPTLREWISTWQSTDRGRCIVSWPGRVGANPDLTALSQGPGHHMRPSDIRHTVLSRKCRMMRKASEMHGQSVSIQSRTRPRAWIARQRGHPAYLTCRSKSCHSPRSSNSQPSVRRPASRDGRSTLRLDPHRAAALSLEWRIVHHLPQACRLPTCDRASAPFDHVPD